MNKNRMETSTPSVNDIQKHLNAIDEELANLIVKRTCYKAQAEQLNESTDKLKNRTDIINKINIPAEVDPETVKKIYRDIMSIFDGQQQKTTDSLYEELKKYYY